MNGLDICASLLFGGLSGTLLFFIASQRTTYNPDGKTCGRRTERKLEKTLPEILERIAGGLSAGSSLQQSLETVGRLQSNPSAKLFSSILTQVKAGQSLDLALEEAAGKFSRRSLPLALYTMAQTQRSGANLVESLNLLARISRDRESLRKKISTMSAQGRLQGIVLCLVPILFMAGLSIASPQSLVPVLESSLGRTMLLLAFLLQIVGGAVIIKMVNREMF